MSDTTIPMHIQRANDIRALADFIEHNPDLFKQLDYTTHSFLLSVNRSEDPVSEMAKFIRAGMAQGAKITKDYSDKYGSVKLTWGAVSLDIYAPRDQVCERVVTSTETVTKSVPDPDRLAEVPLVEVEEVVETVEWVCKPLLAASTEDGAK